MKIAFNPSTVAALTTPPNNKDITFDLRGRNIFARGVKFCGTDTNTWRDIKINNVSIGSHTLDLRNGSNTTLTNTNGVVTINSTWRPVVDNLTSDSTTSSLSAKQGKVLKSLIDGKSNSGHTHDDRYLKLTGGTMASNALITFADSGSWGTDKGPQGARGGLYWTGQSDYAKLYAEETVGDNLDLVIQFGDDNSNGLSIRNASNVQTSYISAGGVITTRTFKGNLDWSYITNKPSSYTPSAHTHAWNSLTHSSTTENQAILTNGKANGWKLYTLNISRWDNAANNAHSHANKSVLDGITSALVNNWNVAYTFVNTITGTDTDKVINKWDEIVNFLAGITEDNKLNTLLNSKLSIQQLSAKDILTTKTNNALFWVNTIGTASSITTGPFTDHPYALLSVTNYNQNAENHKFFYRSRLAFSSAGDIKVASCHHENEYQQDETWYNILTSKNSGINGSTIKLNGTSITVYSSSTADGRYVKKSGDTMTGVLTIDTTNFGALTIKRNDDANGASIQFRGKSSVYGYIGLNNSTKDKQFLRWNSDTSKTYTILDTSSTYTSNGKGVINGTTITQVDNATNSTNSTNARKLVNWYSARPTSLNTQFGDGSLRIFYATSSTTEGKPAEDSHILHLAWDNNGGWDTQLAVHTRSGKISTRAQNSGTWQPWKTLAFTTDIPSSLKNPYSLTTFGVVYDGSAAKTVTTSTFISQVTEGTSTITDGTMFITSYASNNGFADTNAVNVPYKRKAIHLWEYIKAKTDSIYAVIGHNHDDRYLKLTGGTLTGDLYINTNLYGPARGNNPRNRYDAALYFFNCNSSTTSTYNFGLYQWDNEFQFTYRTSADNKYKGNSFTIQGSDGQVTFAKTPKVGSALISLNGHTHAYLPLSGGTVTGNIILKGGTSADMTYAGNVHPYIRFDNSDSSQNISLIFTDYDAYRRPAGIKLVGNQGNEWFEATNIYATTFYGALSGNATTATNADKLDGTHLNGIFTAFGNNAHNITATIGGVTKSFLVNWAADSDKLDGYHENSFLRYRGDTSTDQEATLWSQIGIKQYNNALPDNLTGVYNYGSVISLPGSSSRFEIYASHQSSNGNGLYYRSGWSSDKKSWLKFIDSSNIGSQSVNYANSAGNADKLDGIHANGLLTALSNTNNGISITVGGTTKSVSNISVNYASSAGNADTLDGVHLSGIFTTFGNNNHNITATIGGVTKEFRVNYASDADTLDGEHASSFVRAGHYESADLNKLDTYSFIRSVNSQVSSTSPKGNIGWYNVIQLVHRNGDDDGPNYIGQIALGMTSNVNDIFFRCRRTDPWKTIIHSNNYTEFINNYYWANVKISASSSTTTSPTVSNLTATSSIRMGNIYLQNTNEINSSSGIHLNYQNSGNISLCYGGGKVGIGTISPAYKLDVNGNIHSSGTINCNALNVGSTLSIKDSVISCSASDISIESKESGRLLINSREVLSYNLDRISMTNKTQFVHRLGLGASSPDPITNIHTTDDVTVYIGSLTESSFFEFRPAMDGQLLFLKIGKLYSNTYFWCTARNCEVIRANNFSTYLNKNQNKDCFGDGCARIFIYKQITERWYEFYCG